MDIKGYYIIEKIQDTIKNIMSKGLIKYKKMEKIQSIPYFYSDILFFYTVGAGILSIKYITESILNKYTNIECKRIKKGISWGISSLCLMGVIGILIH